MPPPGRGQSTGAEVRLQRDLRRRPATSGDPAGYSWPRPGARSVRTLTGAIAIIWRPEAGRVLDLHGGGSSYAGNRRLPARLLRPDDRPDGTDSAPGRWSPCPATGPWPASSPSSQPASYCVVSVNGPPVLSHSIACVARVAPVTSRSSAPMMNGRRSAAWITWSTDPTSSARRMS